MAEGAKIDMAAHERSYASFISLAKWGAAVVAFIAACVILIIAR